MQMLTFKRSARTALLVTGPATSATSLAVALPSSVPFWWKNPPPLLVMHWFLMIVFRPVGLKAPPHVCPGTRQKEGVNSCKKITKKETRGSCIVFDTSSAALCLLSIFVWAFLFLVCSFKFIFGILVLVNLVFRSVSQILWYWDKNLGFTWSHFNT